METISSMKNPKVAAWRSLKEKKGREAQQAFLVEGTRMVRESLASSFTVSVNSGVVLPSRTSRWIELLPR